MALLCNATDIHMTGTTVNAPSTGDPISIATWITTTWNTTAARSMVGIYGPSAAAPVTAIQMGGRTIANAVYVWTWGGAILVNSAAGVVSDNVPAFITYTFDELTHRLYVNGVLAGTTTTEQIPGQFNTFYINGYPTGLTSECSNQIVDSVSLYNRSLSAAEILTMYNSRGARHNIQDGLLAHYEFNEKAQGSQVTTCLDLSGNLEGGGNVTSIGSGTPMTYTYLNGKATLRPAHVN